MSAYEIYLTFHVLMAVVWLGGGLAISVLGWRMSLERNAAAMASFGRNVEWVGTRVFTPASLILLVLGFLLIHEGGWSYSSLWIGLALVLYAVTFLTGLLFLGPQSGKLAETMSEHGPESPETRARLRRILFVSRLDLVTLFTIAGVMLVKPTGDDVLILLLGGLAVLALAVAVTRSYVRGAEAAEAATAPST